MASGISYLNEVWNPITGCTPVSPGCDHCFARGILRRFHGGAHGPVWHPERLYSKRSPVYWRRPRRIGVCFMGDLWHPDVQPEWRAQIREKMLAAPQHTYLLLTKRSLEMHADVQHWGRQENIWHGVTVEDPGRTIREIDLVNTPAANRWISVEPLLGPLVLGPLLAHVRWLVVGCESGPGARPCPLEWVEGVVDQCQRAGVPVFVKQIRIGKGVEDDPAQFPAHLRVRQYPEGWK